MSLLKPVVTKWYGDHPIHSARLAKNIEQIYF